MSKLTDKFKLVGIYNSHNFYWEAGEPFITYSPAVSGRGGQSARWRVFKPGVSLSEHWDDHGAKTFLKWGDKKKSFAEAQAWEGEKFGVTEWMRDPFGSYGNRTFVEARTKELARKADDFGQDR
mgnify:CR=1 FL=1